MSRKIIKAVSINNFSGVVVDTDKWHSRKIYKVFGRLSDSLDDFRYTTEEYKDGEYRKVNMNTRTAIKAPSKNIVLTKRTRDISRAGAKFIRNEQIENFRWLNSQIEEPFDMDEVIRIIEEAPIKVFYDPNRQYGPEGKVKGYTHPDGYVAFNLLSCVKNDISSRILRFHEYIHLVQGKLQKEGETVGEAVNEAQTESLAQRRVSPQKSTSTVFRYTNKKIMANFNFDVEHYPFTVCLLRQMEAVMGRTTYQKNFYSASEFSKEFIKRYGIDLYTFVTSRMEIMDLIVDKSFLQKQPYYIEDTQNKLLKEVFRVEFSKMKTIDDAKRVFEMFHRLELNRVDLYEKTENRQIKNINQFESFYNRAYRRIGNRLLKLGYSKQEIISELEQYSYKKQEFYPMYSQEEIAQVINENAENFISAFNDDSEDKEKYSPKHYKITYCSANNGDKYIGIIDRRTKKLIRGYVWQDVISKFLEKEPEITTSIVEYLESDEATEVQVHRENSDNDSMDETSR